MKKIEHALIFLWENTKEILYPQTCIICGRKEKEYVCKKCEKILKNKLLYKIDNYKNKYFSKHIYVFKYEGIIRSKIIDFKFNGKSYLAENFAKIILKNEKICRFFESYDIIIPVPIHNKRKAQRGYNQSELIAKQICKINNKINIQNDILIKEKNNVAQSSLNKEQRIQNAKNVYKIINKEKILNKKIIIIDDIYTTGSTVNECSKILIKNGAIDVLVLTIAKD